MKDENKTKKQLIQELAELRKEADEFSAAIDQWMKADDTLQESDERYRTFFQNFQGILYRGDMCFRLIIFQGAVEPISRYKEGEFTAGEPRWDQIIPLDDLQEILREAEEMRSKRCRSAEREYCTLLND